MRSSLLLAATAIAASTQVSAQTDWTLLAPTPRPALRAWMAMSFDLLRGQAVMTGGFDNVTGNALGDTWLWDGANWVPVAGTVSPPRDCMDMAFAISTGRTILFGGLDSNFTRLGDTWEFDGTNWTSVAGSGPSPRTYMMMAYDIARDRVVAFGGGVFGVSFADTWEYDPLVRQWTQIMTTTTPPAREEQGMVYDPDRALIVMHGGSDATSNLVLTDTWEFDGVDWRGVPTATAPTPRVCFGMVYDTLRDRVVLHGGADMAFTTNFNDTWEFDGATWTRLQPLNAGPGRAGIGMVHDPRTGRSYVFGGEAAPSGPDFDETWEFRTVNPAAAARFGSGCAGSSGIPLLSASDLPWTGTSPDLQLASLPSAPGVAVVFAGFSNTTWLGQPLPVSLAAIGMPGCSVLTSSDASVGLTHGGSSVTLPLQIPAVASLAGLDLHAQVFSLDAASSNGIGAVSAGLTLTIGSR